MNRLSIVFVFSALITCNGCNGAAIRPSASLYLVDGEGFVAYLELAKSFGAVENCWFQFRDQTKVLLPLNATDPITTDRNELVLPFSSTVCGIRVQHLSAASAAAWTLIAENAYGELEHDQLTVHLLPQPKKRFDTHVERDIGKGNIACTKHETYTKHCKITDPQGVAWHQCELYTTIRPNQTFDCRTYNWGRMEESYEHIIVDIKEGDVYSTASIENNTANMILRCQFKETSLHSCQAEMPDNKTELYIMDGLYNGRYSSYDTITSKSKCALEIPKPLDASDIGLWRILNYETGTVSGCVFHVGKSRSEIIATELERLNTIRIVKAYAPENNSDQTISEMYFMLPFIIEDCYLRDPNNTVYFPDAFQFAKTRLYGKCAFQSVPIIAGLWVCGARGRDYDKEVLQQIEVIVKPKGGEVLTERVKVKTGRDVQLMCESAFEDPISHCAFISPHGHVHLVGTGNSLKTKGHVHYYGRGIEYGECGIKITEVNADDYGEWTCQFVLYGGKRTSTFVMLLKESETAQASSVGMGIGVSIIIVLVLGVAVGTVFYRRRNSSARHNFVSTDTLHGSISMPTMATTEA